MQQTTQAGVTRGIPWEAPKMFVSLPVSVVNCTAVNHGGIYYFKTQILSRDIYMVCGRWQRSRPDEVSERSRPCRLCDQVKHSLLNCADCPEFPGRKAGARACARSSAPCSLCPRRASHSNGYDKMIKQSYRYNSQCADSPSS